MTFAPVRTQERPRRRIRRIVLAGAVLALTSLVPLRFGVSQTPLVADLSDHTILISTGFVGASVVFFGAVEERGDDVLILVRGPESNVQVFKKERILGLWINTDRVVFSDVPSFYLAASSRPVEDMIPESLSDRLGLGLHHLRFPADEQGEKAARFQDALIRIRNRDELFVGEVGQVSFLGGRLFRTTIRFPSNVPTGNYVVETYLIREGEIVTAQTTPFNVAKVGIEAWLVRFAHGQPALYGLIAVIIAAAAGWGAAWAFRRG